MARQRNTAAALERAENQAKALELRRMGLGFEEIGAKLSISTPTAFRYVSRGLAAARAQVAASADELRAEEISRLDGMLAALWPRARRGEAQAIDRVLKIMERRARMLGLDAPERRELTGKDGGPIRSAVDMSGLSDGALQELLAAARPADGG